MRLPLSLLSLALPWLPADTPAPLLPAVAAELVTVASPAAGRGTTPPDLPRARVIGVSPLGERVPVGEPVRVTLSAPAPADRVTVTLEPDVPTRRHWESPTRLVLAPETRWRGGRAQRVTIELPDEPRVEFGFRTEVPEPRAVVPGEGKRVILTFDDGPQDRRQADRLLDVLREHEARVIFFPTGRWARQRKDWVERAVDEGHWVCNHTFSHRNLTLGLPDDLIRFEIENGAGHGTCRLFRPPLMAIDKRVERIARELGYDVFLWDIDSRDWQDTPAVDVERTVLGQVRPDAVVLLHMHAAGTMEALPSLLPRLRDAGYLLDFQPAAADGGAALELPRPAVPAD